MMKPLQKMQQVLLLILVAFCFFSCSSPEKKQLEYITVTGLAQGTYYRVVYEDSVFRKPEFDSILKKFDTTFSVYIDESMISKINHNVPNVKIDNQFKYFLQKSQYVASITDSVFDITVAPLVNAWRFGPDTTSHLLPTQAQIDSIREFVGMDKFSWNDSAFIKSDPRVQIIGNAIAQGYSTDIIAQYLDEKGVKNYLVDVGCEMRSKGHNSKGNEWSIAITRPEEGVDTLPLEQQYDVVLTLNNRSLATSGNYRKFYYQESQKYSHTVNPKTGQTIPSDLLSATVIGEECIEVDAIATACMVMGVEKSKQFFSHHPEYDALLMYVQGDSLVSYKTQGAHTK